jgi:hypothetical protein
VLTAMRNVLLHRFDPGRTVSLNPSRPHLIDLDLWYDADWTRAQGGTVPESRLKFSLDPDALIKLRDWIDEQLTSLSSGLCSLAATYQLT